MSNKQYSKTEIIKFTRKYGQLEHEFDQTTLEKRLQNIIVFLNTEEVQNILDYKKDTSSGAYFYNRQMNFTRAKGAAYKKYDYNLIDTIFLAVLLSLFDQPFFKHLRTKKTRLPLEWESDWISSFSNRLNNFKKLWNIENGQIEWNIVLINLEALFYQFISLYDVNQKAKKHQSELQKIFELFEELPDLQKTDFYKTELKSSITEINNKFNNYVQNIKEKNPDEYANYEAHKKLIKIDRRVEKRLRQSTSSKTLLEEIRDQSIGFNE